MRERRSLDRPLDFAAVTDHAEWMAEVVAVHDRAGLGELRLAPAASIYRGEEAWWPSAAAGPQRLSGPDRRAHPGHREPRPAGDRERLRRRRRPTAGASWLGRVWRANQEATERWYDRTSRRAGSRPSTPGSTATSPRTFTKIHRNVILRNATVPELPVSWIDQPESLGLWEELDRVCNQAGSGCEAIAIPHNPNLSNGRLFTPLYRDEPLEEQQRQARLRARMEPVVEMMQVKGESECAQGFALGDADELCGFEKLRTRLEPETCEDGETGSGALNGRGCRSRLDFVRYALVEGLRERERIGTNPYEFGFIGSTDTHNSTPGDVEEYSYQGCCLLDDEKTRLASGSGAGSAGWLYRNPGGLMGAWAEENSRDALFDAMKRRETFATSGPRIQPRLFAGWDLPEDLCGSADFARQGYARGVPMGTSLPARPGDAGAPLIAVSAARDAGTAEHPGGLLQRVQIVKAWAGPDGQPHQKVYDVAGNADNGAAVDLSTCTPKGPGADQLCSVWRDPDFDPALAAVYYARVVENPSCRWSWQQCLRLPADARPSGCSDPTVPKQIQERAWTSPVWYTPRAEPRPLGVPARRAPHHDPVHECVLASADATLGRDLEAQPRVEGHVLGPLRRECGRTRRLRGGDALELCAEQHAAEPSAASLGADDHVVEVPVRLAVERLLALRLDCIGHLEQPAHAAEPQPKRREQQTVAQHQRRPDLGGAGSVPEAHRIEAPVLDDAEALAHLRLQDDVAGEEPAQPAAATTLVGAQIDVRRILGEGLDEQLRRLPEERRTEHARGRRVAHGAVHCRTSQVSRLVARVSACRTSSRAVARCASSASAVQNWNQRGCP